MADITIAFAIPAWLMYAGIAYLFVGVGVTLSLLVEEYSTPGTKVNFLLIPPAVLITIIAWPGALWIMSLYPSEK
jgi:hypothetical protein